jgi:hypothetical protein
LLPSYLVLLCCISYLAFPPKLNIENCAISQHYGLETSLHELETRVTRDRCYDFQNIFAKRLSVKIGVLTQNKAKLCKLLITTLVFEKNANFCAENCLKSPKIVIITSTPDEFVKKSPELQPSQGDKRSL